VRRKDGVPAGSIAAPEGIAPLLPFPHCFDRRCQKGQTMPIVRRMPSKLTIIRGMSDKIDELVRRSPERAHDVDFFEQFAREVG